MAAIKTLVLITGGNGGIGFELAVQLLSDASKYVLLGSRSLAKGQAAVKDLQSRKLPGTVELIQVDVSSEDSVVTAAKEVESRHGRLDALVNNAAIGTPPGSLAQQLDQSFRTNATGPAIMVEAFAPLLKKSTGTPRIVNVTSGAGSIATRLDSTSPFYDMGLVRYRASKAALNMITACQSVDYGPLGWKVFAFCPGFTVSNLSEQNTAANGAKPTSEGAAPIVDILNGKRDGEHGGYLHVDGQHPW
ncbi:NAD(P)-binding protein [Lindgomyces ingoldianus]|uniref:NAD(P)-binding protein n=1 Tax=Lindgomyces ingoldianus TaxID=673940 RepID=A0ACB6QGG1_9PLEO|nr:NAD(P)-binding protein [Lindgomyces ingoldianus]KAF2465447.1 NAD(P)-binding protein [Lindgomyces ingoldianus]